MEFSEKLLIEHASPLIERALCEDISDADITTEALIPKGIQGSAKIIAREDLVVCGQKVVELVFSSLSGELVYKPEVEDGTRLSDSECIGRVSGSFAAILTAERTALNFLQRLSGIATSTNQMLKLLKSEGVDLLDTRKTTPGWRYLEKYAVSVGGGTNHREGLFDAFLIKNNHIDAFGGSIAEAIESCRKQDSSKKLEVEVRDSNELEQAIAAKPDAILLDNMSLSELRESVEKVRSSESPQIYLEASGGITSQTVAEVASTGVNGISTGSITHSVKASDISLRFEELSQND